MIIASGHWAKTVANLPSDRRRASRSLMSIIGPRISGSLPCLIITEMLWRGLGPSVEPVPAPKALYPGRYIVVGQFAEACN